MSHDLHFLGVGSGFLKGQLSLHRKLHDTISYLLGTDAGLCWLLNRIVFPAGLRIVT